jgi:hypothetical protein
MTLTRRIAVAALALLLSLLAASPALAQKPGAHIVGELTITKTTAGLTVSGKGAGFGNFVTEAFLTAERVEAVFQCRNPGGNIAPGQGVELFNVVGPTQTITPRAGHITFNVTLPAPPTPSPAEVCPNPNWTVELVSLTFFGVELHFEQAGEEVLVVELGDIDP